MKLLMIDSHDSFTWNLVHAFEQLGAGVEVALSDEIDIAGIERATPSAVVLSSGSGGPDQNGATLKMAEALAGRLPLLGVGLGHQILARACGATIVPAGQIFHGRTSAIHHNGEDLFSGLPGEFPAARYHSLAVERASLPDSLVETAWTLVDSQREEVMALRHREWPLFGLQFHPESTFTERGEKLLANFLEYVK